MVPGAAIPEADQNARSEHKVARGTDCDDSCTGMPLVLVWGPAIPGLVLANRGHTRARVQKSGIIDLQDGWQKARTAGAIHRRRGGMSHAKNWSAVVLVYLRRWMLGRGGRLCSAIVGLCR